MQLFRENREAAARNKRAYLAQEGRITADEAFTGLSGRKAENAARRLTSPGDFQNDSEYRPAPKQNLILSKLVNKMSC